MKQSVVAESPPVQETRSAMPDLDLRDLASRLSRINACDGNLRFGAGETMETRVFGRLSAWQNWIFIRPNAVGETGALKVFGTGSKAKFDWDRV